MVPTLEALEDRPSKARHSQILKLKKLLIKKLAERKRRMERGLLAYGKGGLLLVGKGAN